jgi:hypothetical protein
MKNLTLFVSSSDSYRDCWIPFFSLMERFWPNCDLPIILNTETESFSYEGLAIRCTQTGPQQSFGETFHKGLDQVNTDNILLIMVDYWLMKEVDEGRLQRAYRTFISEKLDGLYLVDMKTITETVLLSDGVSLIAGPGVDRFSFQAALWKTESLRKYVLKHESPWLAEKFGSRRYTYTRDRLAFVDSSVEPFDYLHSGALYQGGWIKEAIPALESFGVSLDWNIRGFYEPREYSLWQRLKRRCSTAIEDMRSETHLLGMRLRGILG